MIGETPVKFKIDTGADLNIMEEETFNMLCPKQQLVQSNIPPMSSPGSQLTCVGKFQANAQYKEKQYSFSCHPQPNCKQSARQRHSVSNGAGETN